jgi:hypothetical protein
MDIWGRYRRNHQRLAAEDVRLEDVPLEDLRLEDLRLEDLRLEDLRLEVSIGAIVDHAATFRAAGGRSFKTRPDLGLRWCGGRHVALSLEGRGAPAGLIAHCTNKKNVLPVTSSLNLSCHKIVIREAVKMLRRARCSQKSS